MRKQRQRQRQDWAIIGASYMITWISISISSDSIKHQLIPHYKYNFILGMLSQIFKNVYMRLDEKAVTMAQPQKMWSGILVLP